MHKTAFVAALSAALHLSASAYDIRLTPAPDPAVSIKQFGYTAAQNTGMLNGTMDYLWAQVPPKSWSTSTYALRTRMSTALVSAGMDQALSNVVINMCKVYARDPYHCTVYATSVSCAESSCGEPTRAAAASNNIFGLTYGQTTFKTRTEAVKYWVSGSYKTSWYTANEGYFYSYCKSSYFCQAGVDYNVYFFYSNVKDMPPTSHYCMSEPGSPGGSGYCPTGYANANTAYSRVR